MATNTTTHKTAESMDSTLKSLQLKGFVTDNLSSIYKDFMDLLQKGIIINVLTDNYKPKEEAEPEKNEEKTATKKTKSFEEYPTQIQKDALQIIEKGKLFNNIKETAQLTHANDNKLIETLILIHASIYSGTPVQTIVGGETGKGKTDITQPMKALSITSVALKSEITPSRRGRIASTTPGVRPSIRLADSPTASTLPVFVLTATTDGSLRTTPFPRT